MDAAGGRQAPRRLTLVAMVLIAGALLAPAQAMAEQASSSTRSFQSGRIDAGYRHTCAVLSDGTVRCWGDNLEGRLGYGHTQTIGHGTTLASAAPVDLGAGRSAVAVAAGYKHTCALLDNGTVRCWGENGDGELGYGNTNDIGDNETPGSVGPVDLGAGRTAVAITAGGLFTCAVLDNGTVRCWGQGGFGPLGYGNQDNIGDNETPGSVGPVDLGAGRSAVTISAGFYHTCAVLDNGTLRCWGRGYNGELGYGNTNGTHEVTPASVGPVDLGAGRTAVAVSAGGAYTCAILDNGTIRCWGYGGSGGLGYGNTNNIGDDETPASVGVVDIGAGRSAVAIGAGASSAHTCALLDSGSVRCWGNAASGQLGYGNTIDIGDDETPGSAGPVNLGTGRSAVSITTGAAHTCALLDNGRIRCWGEGVYGALGVGSGFNIGDNESPAAADPVNLGQTLGFHSSAIATGGAHTCALIDDGTLRCWGDAVNGQLGYGNTTNIGDNENPGAAGPVNLGTGRSAVSVTAGTNHTCALLENGTVRCWGASPNGELGYGNTTPIGDNEAPGAVGPVSLGRSAVSISAGSHHTCALLDNGTVRCWGWGASGQLGYASTNSIGDGESPASIGPVDLGSGRTAVSVSAGGNHTCARLDNGTVRCWGLASSGQLGYGNQVPIGDNEAPGAVGPVDLGAGRNAVSVAAGSDHTCAVLDNRTLRCWGAAAFGKLGYANEIPIGDNETPGSVGTVNVGLGRSAVAVSGGGFHTCARLDNGTMRCWGAGGNGQLGYGYTDAVGDNETPGDLNPLDLGAGRNALSVSTGEFHSCGVLENGTVRCWGGAGSGRLGYGNLNQIGDNETPGTTGPVDVGDDLPAAVNDSATVAEDSGATAIPVLTNDTDVDGGPTTISLASDPANGTVVLTGGTAGAHTGLTYAPDVDYCNNPPSPAADTFAYTLNGGSQATVSVTVTCVDDNPVAVADSATVGEDSSATAITVLTNDTDIDAGPKTISTASDPANGTVALTGGTSGAHTGLTYAPDANYCNNPPSPAADTFTYTLNGGSQATVSMTVTCVDDNPVAVADTAAVIRDSGANAIDVLGNDTDIDAGPKTITSAGDPANGTVVLTGGTSGAHTGLTYQPDTLYCNNPPGITPDTFSYTLNGGSTAIVSVTVTCVDIPPVAMADSATKAEDSGATAIDVLGNDLNSDGGPLTISIAGDPTNGTVELTGGTSGAHTGLTYAPDANYCNSGAPNDALADDTFTYTVNGGTQATVSVAVTCVDDGPAAVADSATVVEDSSATAIPVLTNDTDIDAGPKTISGADDPANGTVALTGGTSGAHTGLTYAPDANYCNNPPSPAADTFTYTVNGGTQAMVSVTVTCVDDGPAAVADSATVAEDSSASAITVLTNDTDIDAGPKTISTASDPANGTVALTGGTMGAHTGLTYAPDPNYCNDGAPPDDTFTYTVNGGLQATVSVTVTCVDDAPVAIDDAASLVEDAAATAIPVLANDTDLDAGTKLIASATQPLNGTVALSGGTAGNHTGLTYQPNANYCNNPPNPPADTFTYTLTPGNDTATVSVSVSCVDDLVPAGPDPPVVRCKKGRKLVGGRCVKKKKKKRKK